MLFLPLVFHSSRSNSEQVVLIDMMMCWGMAIVSQILVFGSGRGCVA